MRHRMGVVLTGALVAVLSLGGCQTIGVGTVQRDRLDYAGAIADSWKEQTLLNIVKLRYFDTPTFLDISSVISAYQLQTDVRIAREVFPNAPADTNRTLGLSGTFTDRPTISYTPLSGEKFVNSLLRPIPPSAVFAMILAGHQADYILRAIVRSMNDVYNLSAAPARARGEDPAFGRVVAALRRIQQAGALGLRVDPGQVAVYGGGGDSPRGRLEARGERQASAEMIWIFFREAVSPEVDADVRFVREALGLAPDAREIRLIFGSLRRSAGDLVVLTRSIMEILLELSAGVDVPAVHVEEGRARPAGDGIGSVAAQGYPLARINASSTQPTDAYVAARYRGYWFWVDDRDLASKRVFTFLRIFSSIAETGVAPQLPILTVPAN